MFAIFFFATLYVQQILHLSPVQAGPRLPAADGRDHRRLGPRPAADRRASGSATWRWPAWRSRPSACCCSRASTPGRHLPHRRAARHPRDRRRARLHVRPADADRAPRTSMPATPASHRACSTRRSRSAARSASRSSRRSPRTAPPASSRPSAMRRARASRRAPWSRATTSASWPAPRCCCSAWSSPRRCCAAATSPRSTPARRSRQPAASPARPLEPAFEIDD